MNDRNTTQIRTATVSFRDWLQDLELLVKFRLSSFVVFSSAIAYLIAAGGAFSWMRFIILCIGGALITFSANILNEVLEKDFDRLMERTANRPLAAGRWTTSSALVLAGVFCIIGIVCLALLNPLTGFLGMLSLVIYAFLYTPMKRFHTISVMVGAIPGALPVMIGAIAHDGVVTSVALFLFAIQFIWQFPHFWAIGFLSFDQYHHAGYKLLPSEKGHIDRRLASQTVVYTAMFLPVLAIGFGFELISWQGVAGMSLLVGFFLWRAWQFYISFDRASARALMFGSFIFLPAALMMLWASM